MKEEKLFMAFKMFDIDGSGKISAEELKQILGSWKIFYFEIIFFYIIYLSEDEKYKDLSLTFWEQMIKEVDKNGDGEVFYNFFCPFKPFPLRWIIMNLLT